MISQPEFVSRLIGLLSANEIRYMLCGSVASSFHGEPRATKDVDLVIDGERNQLRHFLRRVHEAGWYVSDTAAMEAIQRRTMFNVIDSDSGWKADLIVRKNRAFSVSEFERRLTAALFGPDHPSMALTTPEDTILSKLEWSKGSQSRQQYLDALHVAIVSHHTVDHDYLRQWAQDLGVADLLERLLAEVDEYRGRG